MPGGLRAARYDRYFFTDNPVEQGRFANIRRARQRDHSEPMRFRHQARVTTNTLRAEPCSALRRLIPAAVTGAARPLTLQANREGQRVGLARLLDHLVDRQRQALFLQVLLQSRFIVLRVEREICASCRSNNLSRMVCTVGKSLSR